ncbi:dTDP-4-dehydrorhamnose reductase [Robertkochia flava]|uniref:dTDP-4-dehydrorhamnose reductase n=1 Tax=Robertkochia flava TaxID=3447986 RepID=UPI001CCF27E4|nr:dTDP-4-dehydrorhamnose reductase [Robertkochia marina]
MKRVLVTGANGQLGMSLRDIAGEYNDLEFDFKSSADLDITSSKSIEEVFERSRYDYCINCAAYTAVDKAEEEPEKAFAVNADAVHMLAETCKENNVVLIQISTDYVFDGEKTRPYTIADLPNPINVYGQSKLKGEIHVQEILKEFFIVRVSWLYSKKHGKNFYKTILKKAGSGEELKIVSDQYGCPTDTANLSQYLISLICNDETFGIKHFCDGKIMNWYDFAIDIIESNHLKGRVKKIKTADLSLKAKRPKYSVLEVSTLQ